MGSLLNARNLPDHGFPAVAELARRIPTFEAIYDEVEQIERSIEHLISPHVTGDGEITLESPFFFAG